jgi:hypothetical protein
MGWIVSVGWCGSECHSVQLGGWRKCQGTKPSPEKKWLEDEMSTATKRHLRPNVTKTICHLRRNVTWDKKSTKTKRHLGHNVGWTKSHLWLNLQNNLNYIYSTISLIRQKKQYSYIYTLAMLYCTCDKSMFTKIVLNMLKNPPRTVLICEDFCISYLILIVNGLIELDVFWVSDLPYQN